MAEDKKENNPALGTELTLQEELDAMSNTQRAAVLMLLLGEEQAANIIKYLLISSFEFDWFICLNCLISFLSFSMSLFFVVRSESP